MLVMIMMRGLTCHPVVPSLCMSGLYFMVISLCAVFGNLSWQYVNSMNCMTFGGVGVRGEGRGVGFLWGRLVRIVCMV